LLGIAAGEVMAMGDAPNDVEMLQWAGLAWCRRTPGRKCARWRMRWCRRMMRMAWRWRCGNFVLAELQSAASRNGYPMLIDMIQDHHGEPGLKTRYHDPALLRKMGYERL